MTSIDFFSSNSYIYLPTKQNPKVALAVDNANLSKNAFKLYNPFSSKAKFLKKIASITSINLNPISKIFTNKKNKSDFINYLEDLLEQTLHVSVYFATANDKVVLQLQSTEAKILGYLKFPLNEIGIKHIKNEIDAIDILSKEKIIEPYLLTREYEHRPFVLLKELDGDIGKIEDSIVLNLVKKFKKDKIYKLSNHPRVIKLKKDLEKFNMSKSLNALESICLKSTCNYTLVYEHGDFAPWNIVKVQDRYIPFDFEYFVENGLEYFDLVKYYYQVGSLLEGKDNLDLKEYVCSKIDFDEIEVVYDLYMIKEDIMKKMENI